VVDEDEEVGDQAGPWRRSAPTGAIVASSARPQEAMRNGASPHETGDQPGFYRFLDLAGIG
jgi:hypothetical protein